jgi:hypothetical protein
LGLSGCANAHELKRATPKIKRDRSLTHRIPEGAALRAGADVRLTDFCLSNVGWTVTTVRLRIANVTWSSGSAAGSFQKPEPRTVVTAGVAPARLRVHMAVIRKALGERQFGSRYISNSEGGAYSFVGSVVCIE